MEVTRTVDVSCWASQSPVTNPGNAASAIDKLPADISALRRASSQMIFHYRADGDFAENGVPVERMAEIDTRYADAMLGLLVQRGDPALDRDRPPSERAVGCCRDATVLFLALARAKGMPARARVGFAAYLTPGWLIDHVVAEVWDETEGRWRIIDPEMDAAWTPEVNGIPVNWLDLTEDQFVTGPRAWRAARAGTSDPERHVVTPGLDIPATRGWPEIAHHVVHDLAALNKTEMLVWDSWGLLDAAWAGPSPEDTTVIDEISAEMDEISAVTADPAAGWQTLARIGARDGLRVPPVVTSIDPNGGPSRRVDVTRALARLNQLSKCLILSWLIDHGFVKRASRWEDMSMEIFRFDGDERLISAYGSIGLHATRIASGDGGVTVTCLAVRAGGAIGAHPATGDQLFLVIAGAGWVAGADGIRHPVQAGLGARWAAGEVHASGTDTSLTALAVEGSSLRLFEPEHS